MKPKPLIIPFFLMNRGCPHRCIFCNEFVTVGAVDEPITEKYFKQTMETYIAGCIRRSAPGTRRRSSSLNHAADKESGTISHISKPVEIAFYGGNFTGLSNEEQKTLLSMAQPWLDTGAIQGIRISTRPDYIHQDALKLLKAFRVTTVELGAQSLDDTVLQASRRGHSAADVILAISLLKENRFKSGIHLMAGLPGDTPEGFLKTVDHVIALRPDTVRIHPTLVLSDTVLAALYEQGRYAPLSLSMAVELCRDALSRLNTANIAVIRLGLQTTPSMEKPGAIVAGPYHPSFRDLVIGD
jgi:histone acetyltransferase (RNA polymerase elongator complex component)